MTAMLPLSTSAAALALLLGYLACLLAALWRYRRGRRPYLRPIAAFPALRAAVSEAAESARPIHLSLGGGSLGDAATLQTLAGLQVLADLAQPAATSTARLIVTTASPVAVPMAQGLLRRAAASARAPEEYTPVSVRYIADSRPAYAIGAARVAKQSAMLTSVLVGDLRDEYLLLAEPAAQEGKLLVAGSGDAAAQPFVWTTAQHPLVGEEIFAAGAYLGRRPLHLASLVAQDAYRLVLMVVILAGVAAVSLGLV